MQLSKGKLNKDRDIEVNIAGKSEKVFYRSASCNGVKRCSVEECTYTVPIREKQSCPIHKCSLVKTENCPKEFIYIFHKL